MRVDRLIDHQPTLVKAEHRPTPVIVPLFNLESQHLLIKLDTCWHASDRQHRYKAIQLHPESPFRVVVAQRLVERRAPSAAHHHFRLERTRIEIDNEVQVSWRVPQLREGESDLAPVLRSVVGQVSHHLPKGNSVAPTAKGRLVFHNLEENGIRQALQEGSHLRLFSGPSITQSLERWQGLFAEKLIWPPLPTR